jgi:hypothetical protein
MGFSDSFKKTFGGSSSKDIFKDTGSSKGFFSAFLGPSKDQYKQAMGIHESTWKVKGERDLRNRFKEAVRTGVREVTAAGTTAGLGAFSHLFQMDDKGEKPPPVAEQPAVGGSTATAKSEARRRAREAAAKRFGVKSTISTSALGLMGEGAAVGTKKLIGE